MPAIQFGPTAQSVGLRRRLLTTLTLLLTLLLVGTVGFKLFSPAASWIDCLYMTATTMTTVGYGEIVTLGPGGRLFVVGFLAFGIGVASYATFQFGQFLFSNEIQQLLAERRMRNVLENLNGHYIVCGLGRMGTTICKHLEERNKPFVVIDSDPALGASESDNSNWLRIVGDATADAVLQQAGILRARALATVLPTDADNVYVVLSARLLSSRLEIIARASDEAASTKMKRAGANRVVSPYSTGATKMARFMLNPNIEDFLEIGDQGGDFELADVQIDESSRYVGKRLMETDLREMGVIVVGIRRRNGDRLMPPPGNTMIEAGDCLFAFGNAAAVNQMIGTSGPLPLE